MSSDHIRAAMDSGLLNRDHVVAAADCGDAIAAVALGNRLQDLDLDAWANKIDDWPHECRICAAHAAVAAAIADNKPETSSPMGGGYPQKVVTAVAAWLAASTADRPALLAALNNTNAHCEEAWTDIVHQDQKAPLHSAATYLGWAVQRPDHRHEARIAVRTAAGVLADGFARETAQRRVIACALAPAAWCAPGAPD